MTLTQDRFGLIGTVVAVIVIKRRGGTLAIESDPRWAEIMEEPTA